LSDSFVHFISNTQFDIRPDTLSANCSKGLSQLSQLYLLHADQHLQQVYVFFFI